MVTPYIPAPPLDAFKRPRVSPVLIIGGAVFTILFVLCTYELSVLHASFAAALRQELSGNARVRADFGENVRIPYAAALGGGDSATIWADVGCSRGVEGPTLVAKNATRMGHPSFGESFLNARVLVPRSRRSSADGKPVVCGNSIACFSRSISTHDSDERAHRPL